MKKVLVVLCACLFMSCSKNQTVNWQYFSSEKAGYSVMCPEKLLFEEEDLGLSCSNLEVYYFVNVVDFSHQHWTDEQLRQAVFKSRTRNDFNDILSVKQGDGNGLIFQEVILKKGNNEVTEEIDSFPASDILKPSTKDKPTYIQKRLIVSKRKLYSLEIYFVPLQSKSAEVVMEQNKINTEKFFDSFQLLENK